MPNTGRFPRARAPKLRPLASTDAEAGALSAIAWVHGIYYLATGLWPLASMRTFELVSGPKTDHWLVRTVGLLVAAIGGTLAFSARRGHIPPEVPLLATSSAASLAAIDVVYALKGRISRVYLLDAVAEGLLIAGWAAAWRRR